MAQLDKLLSVMIQKSAEALYLDEDQPSTLKLEGNDTPLTKPLNGTRYPANSSIPVIAEAAGAKPITALELWVDGSLAERR